MKRSTSSQDNIQKLRKRLSKQDIKDMIKHDSTNNMKKIKSREEIRKVISKDDLEKMIENELDKNPFYFF